MDNFRDSYFQVDWDLTTKRLKGTYWGKQYDTGRGFAVTVINGGQVVAPTTEVLRLKWEKPDNTTGYVNATIVNGKFIVENIDQMFTVHGSVRADFELSVGGKFVASITFYVNVEKAVAVDAIESSSDFTALQDAVGSVDSLQQQFNNVVANVTVDSEVIAARGTEPTLGARLDSKDAQLNEVFTKGKNLLNQNDPDITLNHTIASRGNPYEREGYILSGYIPINEGVNVVYSVGGSRTYWNSMAAYDVNKVFIANSHVGAVEEYLTPPNTKYIRVAARTLLNDAQIEVGENTTTFEPFGYNINANNFKKLEEQSKSFLKAIPDGSVTYNSLNNGIDGLITKSRNLLNKNDSNFMIGYTLSSKGMPYEAPTRALSGFLSVGENKPIKFSIDGVESYWSVIASFDKNKNLIPDSYMQAGTDYVTPSNTSFIRVSGSNLNKDKTQIEIGEDVTPFIPHGYIVNALNIGSDIPAPEDGTSTLPQYRQVETERVGEEISNKIGVLKFAFCSDTHLYSINNVVDAQQLAELDPYNYLDFIVDGGDLIDGKSPDASGNSRKQEAVDILKKAVKIFRTSKSDILMVRGNHETNFYSYEDLGDEGLINQFEWSNIALSGLSKDPKVVFDGDNPFGGYYYIDYPRAKTRCVFLNTSDVFDDNGSALIKPVHSDIRQKQFNWFCNKALNFMDKGVDREGWGVIIISHAAVTTGMGKVIMATEIGGIEERNTVNFIGVLDAFMKGTSFNLTTKQGTPWQLISDVDFTDQGGLEFICSINGHAHLDAVTYEPTLNRPNIQVVNNKTQERGKGEGEDGSDKYPSTGDITTPVVPKRPTGIAGDGTIISHAFDLFNIDRINREITTIRYGAGVDRVIPY